MSPCPFCGSAPSGPIPFSDQPGDVFAVVCDDCGAVGPADLRFDGAIEKWNMRYGHPVPAQSLDDGQH